MKPSEQPPQKKAKLSSLSSLSSPSSPYFPVFSLNSCVENSIVEMPRHQEVIEVEGEEQTKSQGEGGAGNDVASKCPDVPAAPTPPALTNPLNPPPPCPSLPPHPTPQSPPANPHVAPYLTAFAPDFFGLPALGPATLLPTLQTSLTRYLHSTLNPRSLLTLLTNGGGRRPPPCQPANGGSATDCDLDDPGTSPGVALNEIISASHFKNPLPPHLLHLLIPLPLTPEYTATIPATYDIGTLASFSPEEVARGLGEEYGVTEGAVLERVAWEIEDQIIAHIAAHAPPASTTVSLRQSENLKRSNNVTGDKFDLLQSTETLSFVCAKRVLLLEGNEGQPPPQPPAPNGTANADTAWWDPCPVCNEIDGALERLVCDGCEGECHLQCLDVNSVPDGDWFCSACARDGIGVGEGVKKQADPKCDEVMHKPKRKMDIKTQPGVKRAAPKGKRKCAECGRRGHDKRNCPLMEGRGGEKEGEVVATKSTSRAEGEVVATTIKSRAEGGGGAKEGEVVATKSKSRAEGRGGGKEGEVVATTRNSRAEGRGGTKEGEVVATTRKSRAVPGIKTGRRPQRPSKMESPADNKEEEEEGGDEEEEEEEEEEKKKGWFVCDEPDCGHKCERKTDMAKHMEIRHTDAPPPFHCPFQFCEYKSRASADCRRHCIYKHKIQASAYDEKYAEPVREEGSVRVREARLRVEKRRAKDARLIAAAKRFEGKYGAGKAIPPSLSNPYAAPRVKYIVPRSQRNIGT